MMNVYMEDVLQKNCVKRFASSYRKTTKMEPYFNKKGLHRMPPSQALL